MKKSLSWCHREPTLGDILSEPIVEAVMQADGVDPQELKAMLTRIARNRSAVDRGSPAV